MARTGIALGSNLGDRAANLRAALDGLRDFCTPGHPVLVAPLYETEPVGCPSGSPAFLNSVVEIDWHAPPLELLAKTRALESRLGRTPNPVRNAPRVIDIDILYIGDATVAHPDLTLPHPRMAERLFVLMPLSDIRPDFRPHPKANPVSRLLEQIKADECPPRQVTCSCWPAWDMRVKSRRNASQEAQAIEDHAIHEKASQRTAEPPESHSGKSFHDRRGLGDL